MKHRMRGFTKYQIVHGITSIRYALERLKKEDPALYENVHYAVEIDLDSIEMTLGSFGNHRIDGVEYSDLSFRKLLGLCIKDVKETFEDELRTSADSAAPLMEATSD